MSGTIRLGCAGALAVGLLAASAVSSPAQAPTLTVSPATPAAGQTVTFTVAGRPGQNAVIALSRFSSGAGRFRGQDLLLGSDLAGLTGGTIGPDGRFAFSVQVPADLTGIFHFQAAVADDASLTTGFGLTNGAAISLGGRQPANNRVVQTVPVGLRPAFSPGVPSLFPNFVFVMNTGSNSVSVIDITTDQVAKTIQLPAAIGDAVTTGGKVFVALSGTGLAPDNRVAVIDPSSNTIASTLTVGSRPVGMDSSFDGTRALTANRGDGTVSVIDAAGLTVSTVPVGGTPTAVSGFQFPDRAYVASADGNVFAVDTTVNQVVARIPVGRDPLFPFGLPALNRLYVSNIGDGTVSVIDTRTNSVVTTVQVGGNPHLARALPILQKVYVADTATNGNRVSVIDPTTNTVIRTITVGRGSSARRYRESPDQLRLFVTNPGDNTVSVIDTTTDTVVATIPVGRTPRNIRFTRDGRKAYIMNLDDGTVSVIN
jgi:YVTN family beta-propeller protein